MAGEQRELHFGLTFPGDAIVLHSRLLERAGNGAVPGSYVVVDLHTHEVVGQLGTKGPARLAGLSPRSGQTGPGLRNPLRLADVARARMGSGALGQLPLM